LAFSACRSIASVNKLSYLPALEHLCEAAPAGSDAAFLQQQHAQSGSVEGMVDAAIRRFRS